MGEGQREKKAGRMGWDCLGGRELQKGPGALELGWGHHPRGLGVPTGGSKEEVWVW